MEYLVRKAGYKNGFEFVKDKIRAKTYESLKVKLSFEDYMQMRGLWLKKSFVFAYCSKNTIRKFICKDKRVNKY